MNVSAFSEPFTPRGVAAFGRAKLGWLLLAQFVLASLAAITVAWFFHHGCFPTVEAAIENLPANGEITSGQLDWSGNPQMLAEGRFLAFDVDPEHSGQVRSTTADFQIEFGRESVRVISLFGYADFFYPSDEIIEFNQTKLDPLWKAWWSAILFLIAAATFIILPVTWWILATIYFLPVWLIGFFTNRNLNLSASWKLSSAALMPGALLMIVGILFYGFGFYLVTLLFVFGAHFVLHWLYLFFGLMFFSRTSAAVPKGNPFNSSRKR
jgi:hypothetical protein